ncbi:MAG: hypothetical protein IJ428_01015 [Clostridia bacterium]|nr:hypothetical protein [Clostridia bacterium]
MKPLHYRQVHLDFHTSWGEFGGFKHPNALRYEAALSISQGAKCSIGDERSITTNLPDRGVATYTYQEAENRYVAHLLFAHTTKRGKDIEIIEDIIPLYGIKLTAATPTAPKKVVRIDCIDGKLTETEVSFTYESGVTSVDVDKVDLHAMVVFEM